MKFKIDKKDFLDAIRNINMVVERRNTIAILGNIKLELNDNALSLFATDTDIEATNTIEVEGKDDGVTTVSAQTLNEVIAKLKDGDVDISIKDNDLIVKSGRSRFKLACLDAKDFPVLNNEKYDTTFTIGGGELALLIDNTKFCASNEETRYYLNGVYLHVHGDKLRGVATDGHRMSLHDTEAPDGSLDMVGVIVPNKAIVVIRKMIEGVAGGVKISVSEYKIMIKAGKSSITSKLVDGTFPDYERVLPKSNDSTMIANVSELKGAIDRISTVSDGQTNCVKLSISEGKVEVSSKSGNGSSASEDLIVRNQFGLEIGFNSKYMLDALSHVKADECLIKFDQPSTPTIITGVDASDYVFVVTPLRV